MHRTCDIDQAKQFIAVITGNPDSVVTFQTFDDIKTDVPSLARVFHGTLDQYASQLTALNNRGAGVFVMINEGDGVIHPGCKTCRTEKSVIRVRALFVDLDGAPLQPILEAVALPTLIVESSPERWHAYWSVSDACLEEFTNCQLALAKKFNGDPAIKDLPRVMRLPGFYHQKNEPFMTRIISR